MPWEDWVRSVLNDVLFCEVSSHYYLIWWLREAVLDLFSTLRCFVMFHVILTLFNAAVGLGSFCYRLCVVP